jgi:hypothetical protein
MDKLGVSAPSEEKKLATLDLIGGADMVSSRNVAEIGHSLNRLFPERNSFPLPAPTNG